MIIFDKLPNSEPYLLFQEKYESAKKMDQKNIEAISISSFNHEKNQVSSRFVNLKFIKNDQWIFFTNYNSNKAEDFKSHNQIYGIFYWGNINTQIRINAFIEKTTVEFNEEYFKTRKKEKNALAISSNQSKQISSFNDFIDRYKKVLKKDDLLKCPQYWGGYLFVPHSFEFWEGNENRLNKRIYFKKKGDTWIKYFLQP